MITRRTFLKTLGAGGLFGFGLSSYAFAIEPRFRLVDTRYMVKIPEWGKRKPLRIAVLSDFHFCEPWMNVPRISYIVSRANALKPDLIVMPGDFAPGIKRFRTGLVKKDDWVFELKKLNAPLGVHSVLGNHDWWSGGEFFAKAVRDTGAHLYQNEAQSIKIDGGAFWLSGTDSTLAEPTGRGRFRDRSDLAKTMRMITDDAPVLHLAHEPDLFPSLSKRVSLMFAGHTHGGQVNLPFLGRLVVPSHYGQRYAIGHVIENDVQMIISAGLGVSIAPVRFGVPPEIVLVTVKGIDKPGVGEQ